MAPIFRNIGAIGTFSFKIQKYRKLKLVQSATVFNKAGAASIDFAWQKLYK